MCRENVKTIKNAVARTLFHAWPDYYVTPDSANTAGTQICRFSYCKFSLKYDRVNLVEPAGPVCRARPTMLTPAV